MSAAASSLRDQLFRDGWRQGSVLPPDTGEAARWAIANLALQGEDKIVVLSQSCDLLAVPLDKEPVVEVARMRPIGKVESAKRFGRHPRFFQWVDECGEKKWEIAITDRGFIQREALVGIKPVAQLDERAVAALRSWLSGRYARHAFPDEFMRRLLPNSGSRKSWDSIREACGPDILDIYIGYHPQFEAEVGQPYKVIVRIVVDEMVEGDEARWAEVNDLIHQPLAALFSNGEHFDSVDSGMVTPEDINLREVMALHRLDWDDASYAS